MKGTVRIIAGLMKGKSIPFNNSSFNDADITPQKVKGALFSIIGENLENKIFVDLFSGSGQIAFEALSRRCSRVIINEKDRMRYDFIKDFIAKTGLEDKATVLNMNALYAVRYIAERGIKADVIFIDPPYVKEEGAESVYDSILSEICKSEIIHNHSVVIVQHYFLNILSEKCSNLFKHDVKKYGSTSLSIYRHL